MSTENLTKTDRRALDLLNTGKVHIRWGQRFALAEGSKGQVYKVSKDSCECEASRRYPGPCKHQRSLQAICGLIRLARAEAKATGKTRLPAVVGRALLPFPVAASAPASCHSCGSPLTDWKQEDGRCARCATVRRRLLEMELFGEAA